MTRPLRTFGWLLGLAACFLARFADVVQLPLLFDDYTILEKVRRHSFAGLWAPSELLYGWYRPWSRETYFAIIDRLAAAHPIAFHLAGLSLAVACLVAFYLLARRVNGERAAAVASAGLAAMGAWSGALTWGAGAQETWMLLFALLALHAVLSRRDALATLALAGALLSKETAGVVPVVMVLAMVCIQRESLRTAARRIAGPVALTLAWVVLHPTLRARLLGHAAAPEAASGVTAMSVTIKSLGAFVNCERVPRPDSGFLPALSEGLPALIILVPLLLTIAGVGKFKSTAGDAVDAPDASSRTRAATFGGAWAALALVPLFAPGLAWAPYYVLLAACGAWLAAGCLLAPRPTWAVALVAVVAVLQPLGAHTPAWEWGAHSFQARAAYVTSGLERALKRHHSRLEPHSRLFFADVPQSAGVGQEWFDPAFHVWYRDTTIHGAFLSEYRTRDASEPAGPDLFFRFEPPDGWTEIRLGPEDAHRARAANPRWLDDHRRVVIQLGRANDWPRAAAELEKLAVARPDNPEFPASLAFALGRLGDAAGAARWQARADSLARAAAASAPR